MHLCWYFFFDTHLPPYTPISPHPMITVTRKMPCSTEFRHKVTAHRRFMFLSDPTISSWFQEPADLSQYLKKRDSLYNGPRSPGGWGRNLITGSNGEQRTERTVMTSSCASVEQCLSMFYCEKAIKMKLMLIKLRTSGEYFCRTVFVYWVFILSQWVTEWLIWVKQILPHTTIYFILY